MLKEMSRASQNLDLTLLLADYHRTTPILSGEVTIPGIRFRPNLASPGDACMSPVYEEFDIAEMSLSWYLMARCRGEPVIALPVFPLRMQTTRTCSAGLRPESTGPRTSRANASAWTSTG